MTAGVNLFSGRPDQSVSELKPRRTTMSRTIILSLATAATIAMASLASSAADARGFGGGGLGGGGRSFSGGSHFSSGNHFASRSVGRSHVAALNNGRGGRTGHPGHPGHWTHWHKHHWKFRDGVWIDIDGGVDDDSYDASVAATPGPCTCLTKTYTQDGLVVFADVCTNEAASARVDGTAADITPLPTPEPKASNVTPLPPADSKAAAASQAPTSTNYAGRTYKDFLAVTQAAAQKN
jgi:hypothetical protein